MAQCPGAPRSDKSFCGLHLYLAGKYCENTKVTGAQLNVNPTLAVTWFVGVNIYCTFFNNNSLPTRQLLCNKILLKKISYNKGNAHWANFELRGPGPPGCICTPITGCFHDKTTISKENIRLDCYLVLQCCRKLCTLLSPYLGQITQNLIPKCKILNVFRI